MGKTLYLLSSGALRRKDNTLFVERLGEPGQKPRFLPVETTDEIMVMGDLELNKSLLKFLSDRGEEARGAEGGRPQAPHGLPVQKHGPVDSDHAELSCTGVSLSFSQLLKSTLILKWQMNS